MTRWRCPKCGHTTEQPRAVEVLHACPMRKGTDRALVALTKETDDQ